MPEETQDVSVTQTMRFPSNIHSKIKKIAKEQERSFNWVALRLLQKQLQDDENDEGDTTDIHAR